MNSNREKQVLQSRDPMTLYAIEMVLLSAEQDNNYLIIYGTNSNYATYLLNVAFLEMTY